MRRELMLAALEADRVWDFLVIGGGATGLGIAVDAAARGYTVALAEAEDFAKGTSSRSTKLVHGGVRYLQQGNVALVMDALRERGLLRRNAPHLVHDLAFVVPSYEWWESPFYGIGLKVYDLLAGEYGFGASSHLSQDEVRATIPTIETLGLRGGTRYYDGQFDDARLAVHLALTAADRGAVLVNYCPAVGLLKDGSGRVAGARLNDRESGREFAVAARAVINATGPFADGLRRLDHPDAPPVIAPSQGSHIVLDREFLPGTSAIMVPHTDDGRVMFAIPWHHRVILGTTDVPTAGVPGEPTPTRAEIDFILDTANRYLTRDAGYSDIRAVFAGIRPLVRAGDGSTAALSRDHSILIDPLSGLMTVAGGKWTTYRRMAEDAVDLAATLAALPSRSCPTREMPLHGHDPEAARHGPLAPYGSDAPAILALQRERPELASPLVAGLPATGAEVVWACRTEMARTVEDALSRRTRSLLFDAHAAIAAAPAVARLMANELGRDDPWQADQVASFGTLAAGYLPPPAG